MSRLDSGVLWRNSYLIDVVGFENLTLPSVSDQVPSIRSTRISEVDVCRMMVLIHRVCWARCAALAQTTWKDGSSRFFVGLHGLARGWRRRRQRYSTETRPFVRFERSSWWVMDRPKLREQRLETVVEPRVALSIGIVVVVVEGNEHELMVGDDESKMKFM